MILETSARVAIREGRTDEAMALLDEAEALVPDHPAIAHARGEALGNVWRWKEATVPLHRAALDSPADDGLWAHLAVAYGSADDPHEAIESTAHGLALAPRDADMLRVQALALERLAAPADEVALARSALARWRPPDDAPGLKNACSQQYGWCALERVPLHVHPLHPVP